MDDDGDQQMMWWAQQGQQEEYEAWLANPQAQAEYQKFSTSVEKPHVHQSSAEESQATAGSDRA